MLRKFICLISTLSLVCCLICNNYVFAYENPIEAVADSFDGTSLVEQGCIALKNNVPNYRFCYAYDYDGDGLQEGYAISGIWEEGIENGDLWFIDSDGTYTLVKKGLYYHYLFEPELVYAGNQTFLILDQTQNGKVISLVCGYKNGNAYFPSISERVTEFHSESGHYYAYDVTDYSGEEFLYSEKTGEFINIKNNIPNLDFRNILNQNNWSDIAYILDRWYGDEVDFNNNFQLTYEFIMQQLYMSWDNHIDNDPKGLLNYPYCIEAEFIDSILKTNFNMNDDVIEKLHSEIYSNQYGNVGYYYNNYYYFNPPEGTLQGSLYSIEIIEQKDNAYKIKFVNNDLNSYGVNDPYTRGTYYCIFEVVNNEQGQSFKVHGISKYDNIQWPIKTIKVVLNGEEIEFDQQPIMINDRVMVPIRAIFEAMNYEVNWNQDTKTAVAVFGNNDITVHINSKTINHTVNGVSSTYICDVMPQIVSDRIIVPVRAIAESADCTVDWDSDSMTVIITK